MEELTAFVVLLSPATRPARLIIFTNRANPPATTLAQDFFNNCVWGSSTTSQPKDFALAKLKVKHNFQ
jgi:hypothetical protein